MEILIVQVFVSLLLVASAVLLLAYSVKQADLEHADRLSILPLATERADQASAEGDARGTTTHHV